MSKRSYKHRFDFLAFGIIFLGLLLGVGTKILIENRNATKTLNETTPALIEISEQEVGTTTLTIKPTKAVQQQKKISPTSTADDCSKFYPKESLATITVKLKPRNNKPLYGDWEVKVKSRYPCPPLFSGSSDYTYGYIQNGISSWTSFGFNPGRVHIDVNYHEDGRAFDIDATPGNHIIEMEVANE